MPPARAPLPAALGVAVGSSIQIALFAIPFVVIVGWVAGHPFRCAAARACAKRGGGSTRTCHRASRGGGGLRTARRSPQAPHQRPILWPPTPRSLDLDPFSTVALTTAVIHANFVTSGASSHWLMGAQLIATYVLIALTFLYR